MLTYECCKVFAFFTMHPQHQEQCLGQKKYFQSICQVSTELAYLEGPFHPKPFQLFTEII